ncbi:hypothetical protein ACL1C0_13325 [Corynebacterium striatum]|nr:hypothetical protein [Corynebacterium striatum]HAT1474781.1 hypothetical protein [Corynebacterium striatum]
MADGGVESWTKKSPFIIAFKNEQEAEGFIHEAEGAVRNGQGTPFEEISQTGASDWDKFIPNQVTAESLINRIMHPSMT